MVRVRIPHHLQVLAGTGPELALDVKGPVTVKAVVKAVEARYPMLRGAIFQHDTGKRRPLIRFFACSRDVSLQDDNQPLPERISNGEEPLLIVGAIAGG